MSQRMAGGPIDARAQATVDRINELARVNLSITTWNRLEPRARTSDPDGGLEARVHDPLWLLGRQWQFGEFAGRDAGSPIRVQAELATTMLSSWLPSVSPTSGQRGLPYDSSKEALEVLVEREPATQPLQLRRSAQTGAQFLQLLAAAGMGKYRQGFIDQYPLSRPTADQLLGDPGSARVADLLVGRLPDGSRLAAALSQSLHPPTGNSRLPAAPAVAAADAAAVMKAASAWLEWYQREIAPPSPGYAWVPDRMEHQFTVAAANPAGGGEVVLSSSEYRGDGLDWHDFSVRTDITLGTSGEKKTLTRHVLPAPVTFPGAPAERWWEFEDAAVDMGSIDAAPDDLGRLLLVEFATVFGNDWSIIPVEVPFGSLTYVLALVVTDTFGEHMLVRPSDRAVTAGGPWRMFRLSGPSTARGAERGLESLFVPPVLAGALQGLTREEVHLLRDEAADMAWGVERVVEGPVGDPRNRDDEWQQRQAAAAAVAPPAPLVPLVYRLATSVPDHWIPLLPVHDGEIVRLQRAAMIRFDGAGPGTPISATGRLLEPDRPLLRLFEEEVPREGSRLTRVPIMARWLGGKWLRWTARRKETGRGEGSSGLRYDVAEIHH